MFFFTTNSFVFFLYELLAKYLSVLNISESLHKSSFGSDFISTYVGFSCELIWQFISSPFPYQSQTLETEYLFNACMICDVTEVFLAKFTTLVLIDDTSVLYLVADSTS